MNTESAMQELICPKCHGQLRITQIELQCSYCQKKIPLKNGIPLFSGDELTEEFVYWNQKENTPEKLYENLTDSTFRKLLNAFQIPNNSLGLELGCGDGPFARRLKDKQIDIYGVDISFPLLNLCENMLPIQASALKLPFKTHFFDWIIYAFALHHVPDTPNALQEACRVLKHHGEIFIVDPNYYHPIRFLTRKPNMLLRNWVFTYLSPEERWIPAFRIKHILQDVHITIRSVVFITPEFRSPSLLGRIQNGIAAVSKFHPLNMLTQSYYVISGTKEGTF